MPQSGRWDSYAAHRFAGRPLFVSTHSLEAIDALLGPDEQSAARIVGFHLPTQPATGEVTRYEGPLLARLVRERGLDVR